MFAEHDQVQQGICPQTIRAMDRHTRTFTRRKQPGDGRAIIVKDHLAKFIGGDAAHRVMRRRLSRHHLGDRINSKVDAAEIHNVRNLFQDRVTRNSVGRAVGVRASIFVRVFVNRLRTNIQIDIILSIHAAPLTDFGIDRA
jgi:hypothetical protein